MLDDGVQLVKYAMLIAIAGCHWGHEATDDVVGSDAPPAMGFTYRVGSFDAGDMDPLDEQMPTTFIDGEPRQSFEIAYESFAAARGDTHVVELRYGATIVDQMTVTVEDQCGLQGVITEIATSLCAYRHGELRYGSDRSESSAGVCVGDGFCLAACSDIRGGASCGEGMRCTVRVGNRDPLAVKQACAPIGPKQFGEKCALVEDPAGDYDTCGMGLLCFNGYCAKVANENGAVHATGYPDEFFIVRGDPL